MERLGPRCFDEFLLFFVEENEIVFVGDNGKERPKFPIYLVEFLFFGVVFGDETR